MGGAVECHGRSRGQVRDESVGLLAGEDVADGGVHLFPVAAFTGEMAAGEESENAEAGDGGLAGVGGGKPAAGFLALHNAFEGAVHGGFDPGPFRGSEDVHGVTAAGVLLGEEGVRRAGQHKEEEKAKAVGYSPVQIVLWFHASERPFHLW
jgi:hypothetical protein